MQDALNKCYKIVSKYSSELQDLFKSELSSSKPKKKADVQNFIMLKDKLIGPILFSVRMHLAEVSSTLKKIKKEESRVEKLIEDITNFSFKEKIHASSSMADFWEIDFSRGTDEVFFGTNLEKAESFGVWTDGKEIYKGEFEGGKKHGYGFQIFNDGSIFEGRFERGVPKDGKWKLDTGENFYGNWVKEQNYMIGIKESDAINRGAVKNILYYKGDKTIIKNVDPTQEINIKALKGEVRQQFKLKWEEGIM